MRGSSASAAATAVSIAVRQRIPSAVAASRISAASRTAPERGVGVLTTSRTSPSAMRSRIGTSLLPAPRRAWRRAGHRTRLAPAPRGFRGRREGVAGRLQRGREPRQQLLVPVGDRQQRQRPSSPARRDERGAEQRLGHRDRRVRVDPDDLAGRLHARPDGRIDAASLAVENAGAFTATKGGGGRCRPASRARAGLRRGRSAPPARPSARPSPSTGTARSAMRGD